MAEGILRHLLAFKPGDHVVESAGTLDIEGRPPSANAVLACLEHGVDISGLRSKGLTRAQLQRADVVLCMERRHVDACSKRGKGAAPRVVLLGDNCSSLADAQVPDPVGQDVEAFRDSRDLLWSLCARFLAQEGLLSYTPFYCEENVWHLLADERLAERERYAVFVSNEERQVAMWCQRAALLPGTPVVWDYHVVVVARGEGGFEVWDPDCVVGFRLPVSRWLKVSFGLAPDVPGDLHPRFRVVDGDEYRARLSTDRAHMRAPEGSLIREAPPWPLILPAREPPNLQRFLDVTAPFVGEVLDLHTFAERFGGLADG